MKCHVLLFAHLRELMGDDRLVVELPQGATAGDLLAKLQQDYDAIAKMRRSIAIAVDERYEPLDKPLRDGCTVALIPPVSGG